MRVEPSCLGSTASGVSTCGRRGHEPGWEGQGGGAEGPASVTAMVAGGKESYTGARSGRTAMQIEVCK